MTRRRSKITEDMDATPIPVGAPFVISEDVTGRLSGNASNGSAALDIYRKTEEGVTHMSIDGLIGIVRLAQNLSEFIDEMTSKGSH